MLDIDLIPVFRRKNRKMRHKVLRGKRCKFSKHICMEQYVINSRTGHIYQKLLDVFSLKFRLKRTSQAILTSQNFQAVFTC